MTNKIPMARYLAVFIAVVALVVAVGSNAADDFCWKDSYGRGVGTIPTTCTDGKENQAGLCYDKCPAGMNGVGPVCWSACPPGYVDHGAICHIDLPLTRDGTGWSCQHRDGWGTCWHWVLNCPSGYTNAGLFCALTARSTPAGFSGTYLDPMKNTHARGAGTIPTGCPGGKENQAGLCYDNCRSGFSGVGPVCWASGPSGWVGCGMGSARSSGICASVVMDQVGSVGALAADIATMGASGAAKSAATTAVQAQKYADLAKKIADASKKIVAATKCVQSILDAVNAVQGNDNSLGMGIAAPALECLAQTAGTRGDVQALKWNTMKGAAIKAALAGAKQGLAAEAAVIALQNGTLTGAGQSPSPEEIARVSAQMASSLAGGVPGVGSAIGVAAAYLYPKCNAVNLGAAAPAPAPPVAPPAPVPQPPVPSPTANFVQWNPNANQGAVLGGNNGAQYGGAPLYVCRANHAGGVHPGKLLAGLCNIGYGGREVVLRAPFEVLVGNGNWGPPQGQNQGALIGGSEPGRSLPICRAGFNGGVHPGKVVDGKCNIGWGGQEHQVPSFEVFYTR